MVFMSMVMVVLEGVEEEEEIRVLCLPWRGLQLHYYLVSCTRLNQVTRNHFLRTNHYCERWIC